MPIADDFAHSVTYLHATVICFVSHGDAYQDSFNEFATEGEEENDGNMTRVMIIANDLHATVICCVSHGDAY